MSLMFAAKEHAKAAQKKISSALFGVEDNVVSVRVQKVGAKYFIKVGLKTPGGEEQIMHKILALDLGHAPRDWREYADFSDVFETVGEITALANAK
jgi:hypothetical protein